MADLLEASSVKSWQDFKEMSREPRRTQSSPVSVHQRRLDNKDHEWETLFEQTGKGRSLLNAYYSYKPYSLAVDLTLV